MLHVVAHTGEPREDKILRSMFHARKQVFVDLLKWDVPILAGRYEVDQFDDPYANYIVLADENGEHLASTRLLRTDRPHILDSLFPQLCEGAPPTGPDVREITRFCLDRRLNARDRRRLRNRLVTTLTEYALANGITTYTGVAEIGWCSQILAMGWRCTLLGLPRNAGSSRLAALAIHIDDDTPTLLIDAGTYALPATVDGIGIKEGTHHV